MNASGMPGIGPWDRFWSVVLPPIDVRHFDGLLGASFLLGIFVMLGLVFKRRNETTFWVYAGWIAGVGGLLTVILATETLGGSHGFWNRGPWKMFYIFTGYAVRTSALLFVPLVAGFFYPSSDLRKGKDGLAFLCATAFLMSLLCLTLTLVWEYGIVGAVTETNKQG